MKRILISIAASISMQLCWGAGLSTPRTVDQVFLTKNSDAVVLNLIVDRPWSELPSFQPALNEKLGAYLAFVQNGELVERFPQFKGLPVRVFVYCTYEPDGRALKLIDRYKPIFREHGILLQWMVSKYAKPAP